MSRKRGSRALFMAGFAAAGIYGYRNGEDWIRQALLTMQSAEWAQGAISKTPVAWNIASRFVAGETAAEAIAVAKQLNRDGMQVSLDFLGESVHNRIAATSARNEVLDLLDMIQKEQVDANVSVKLTQLGLDIDEALAYDNITHILQRAKQYGNWVRLDMENTPYTQKTLDTYYQLRHDQLDNSGVVIQSMLFRSREDVAKLVQHGARIRLVKGAYAEPSDMAFPVKANTDENFIALMKSMLSEDARRRGVRSAIATHDDKMIEATIDYMRTNRIPNSAVEFQMLYGVRRELQRELRVKGYPVRVYVPYGSDWYPYFMRRLAERPANLRFFISNFFKA